MSAERRYRGWGIERVHPSGYWRAYGPDLPLMADTLAGLRALIRDAAANGHPADRYYSRGARA